MPAAHQRSAICPLRQRLTLRAWSRQIEIIDSQVGGPQRPGQRGRDVEAEHGQRLSHALTQAASGTGMGLVQLPGQCLQQRLGFQGGVGVVGSAHPSTDRAAHLLRQVVTNIPQLVQLTSGDHRVVEHLLGRRSEGLGTVQDSQDRLGDIQAPLAEPDQQAADQGGVLGGPLDQRQRVFRAVDVDAERDHTQVVSEVHAVDHQRHQVQPGEVTGKQVGQRMFGHRHELARDRRPARRPGVPLGGLTDWFQRDRVAARRDPASIRSIAIRPSSSVEANSSYVATGTSPVPSAARTRGRVTGTRRPPNVTELRSVPCRVAARSGSCFPLGPHTAVTSASIN